MRTLVAVKYLPGQLADLAGAPVDAKFVPAYPIVSWLKYLQGKHDQQTHGRGATPVTAPVASALEPGDIVEHEHLGRGRVLALLGHDTARVSFDGHIAHLPYRQLTKIVSPAEIAFMAKHPGVKARLVDIDPQLREAVLKQVDTLLKKYPHMEKCLELVTTDPPSYVTWTDPREASTWGYAHYTGDTTTSIHLSPRVWQHPERFLGELRETDKSKWHPPGCNTPESVVTHEFGHAVMQSMAANSWIDAVQWLKDGRGFAGSVSLYAKTNENEYFAEMFASLHHTPKAEQSVMISGLSQYLPVFLAGKTRLDVKAIEIKHLAGQPDQQRHAGLGMATKPALSTEMDARAEDFLVCGASVDRSREGVLDIEPRAKDEAYQSALTALSSRLLNDKHLGPAQHALLLKDAEEYIEKESKRKESLEKIHINYIPEYPGLEGQPASVEMGAKLTVAKLLNTWSITSSDSDTTAIAMQRAVAAEFGLSSYMTVINSDITSQRKEMVDTFYAEHSVLYRRALRNIYEYTQEELAKAGIERVVVHRGGAIAEQDVSAIAPGAELPKRRNSKLQVDVKSVLMNPMSSFSADASIANGFAGELGYQVLLSATVPAKRILSTARTGMGALDELEYVVLAGPGKMRAEISPGNWAK